jgi:hypothetical protein
LGMGMDRNSGPVGSRGSASGARVSGAIIAANRRHCTGAQATDSRPEGSLRADPPDAPVGARLRVVQTPDPDPNPDRPSEENPTATI